MNPEKNSPILCMVMAFSLALFGCKHALAPEVEGNLRLETDKNTYHVNEIITVTMINKANTVISAIHCCDFIFGVQRELNGEWRSVEWRLCPALCDPAPIRLNPGEKLTERLLIPEAGRYRLGNVYGKGITFKYEETILSDAFSVR